MSDEHAASEHRVRNAALFDQEVAPHNALFRTAAAVGPRDRVLDIGCGTGESTRDAARAAVYGTVLGVDLSAEAIAHARRLSEGLGNVTYQQADAQVHRFTPEFDLCVSRFGVMFFTDPAAAFANIATALRPYARLVLLVWQSSERNEWSWAVRAAIGTSAALTGPDPFSLADPDATEALLRTAGFTDVRFAEVHEPVYYGEDGATAYDLVLGLRATGEYLAPLDAATAQDARRRLRGMIEAHTTESGVFFDSRAWIITARRSAAYSGT